MLGIYCRTSRETDIENSTIIQQRTAGIKFAEKHQFEYEIYEDEGKSGYKTDQDDKDPFTKRPGITRLINDIKENKIDKVWVWEHSRFSRNDYGSAVIFRLFKKYKIEIYIQEKKFDYDDPVNKLNRVILDAVAEYERELIVARTTRGQRKSIDEGKRSHQKLYCYRKEGKDEKGHTIWVPVESEIENYKYMLKRFMEGATLRTLSNEIYDKHRISKWGIVSYSHFLGRILRGYQYTGYQLTIEGNEIYKQFRKNEIESIKVLLDRKYWIKSVPYPVEIISIETWVEICERLQIRARKINITRKDVLLRASRDIATGLIACGDCGHKFYYKEQKITDKKTGKHRFYTTYFHHMFFNDKMCGQKPKSFFVEYTNDIFKLFFFYFYIVFDNTNDLIVESQRNIKQTELKLKEKIKRSEKEIITVEKRIEKFQKVLDNSADEIDIIKLLLKNIAASEEKLNELEVELSKLKIELELQNEKFDKNEKLMAYYDVKERVNDWFFKLNIEEQRNELIRTIRACKAYNQYLVIDTGKIAFLFDIKKPNVFDMKLLENLNKDEVYKLNFVEMKGKRDARTLNEKLIHEVNLDRDKEIRMRVFQYLLRTYNINYDISEHDKLISFVPLSGIMSLEVETFKD